MTKPTLYLHIGLPKTGTSVLQYALLEKAKFLGKNGLSYPPHKLECNNISSGNGREIAEKLIARKYEEFDREINRVLENTTQKVVLSSEYFWGLHKEGILEIKKHSQNIKIIVYLRRQDTLILSRYNQRIKRHHLTVPITSWVPEYAQNSYRNKELCYDKALLNWSEVFGKENLIVRPYEKQQFYNGNIIADFFHHALGLEFTDESRNTEKKVNISYSSDALEYKRFLNLLSVEDAGQIDCLLQSYSEGNNDGYTNIISPEILRGIYDLYAESNKRTAIEYLGRQDGRLFYDPPPDPQESWRPYPGLSDEKVCKITAYMIQMNPGVSKLVFEAIVSGLKSENENIRQAATTLSPSLGLFLGNILDYYNRYNSLINSRSWRYTAPLRSLGGTLRQIRQKVFSR